MRVRLQNDLLADAINVLVVPSNGHRAELSVIEWGDGETAPPTFAMSREDAQRLMDQLWECGLYPTAMHKTSGDSAALRYHLEDLRTLMGLTK